MAAAVSPSFAETLNGVPVDVLVRSVVAIPNGTVTYLRIRPPLLPAPPAPPPPTPAAPLSPEAQAALEAYESKPYAMLSVSVTVYTRADDSVAVTKLTWRDNDRSFCAWSTADFRLLTQLNDIETASHRFSWFPFTDVLPLAEVPQAQAPAGLALFPTTLDPESLPEYYLEGTEADAAAMEPVLGAFDWLLAYYHVNRVQLAADLVRREAEAIEHARKAAEEAAKPKHEKVFFWKIQ
jgi:hypothetical protein